MGPGNACMVKRSNAILNYNSKLLYKEAKLYPGFLAGFFEAFTSLMFGLCLLLPPLRWFARKFVLPDPGNGPVVETMDRGFLRIYVYAKGKNGTRIKGELYFDDDPSYRYNINKFIHIFPNS